MIKGRQGGYGLTELYALFLLGFSKKVLVFMPYY